MCGLLTGYRFVSYRAGHFIWYRRGGKIHLGRYRIQGTGGQCLLGPPGGPDDDYPYVLYNLGGVLANLLLGAVLLWGSAAVIQGTGGQCLLGPPGGPDDDYPYVLYNLGGVLANLLLGAVLLWGSAAVSGDSFWRIPLLLAGCFSLLAGLPNLIPFRHIASDGSNLLHARRSPQTRRALWLTLAVNEQLTDGRRLREMPAHWFDLPPADSQLDPLTAGVCCIAAQRLMDEGRLEPAAALYRDVLVRCPRLIDVQKNEIACELLLLTLLTQGPGAGADALNTPALHKYIRATAGYPSRQCLLYAMALLTEREPAAAEQARSSFDAAAARYPLAGEVPLYRELMELAQARAAQAVSTP